MGEIGLVLLNMVIVGPTAILALETLNFQGINIFEVKYFKVVIFWICLATWILLLCAKQADNEGALNKIIVYLSTAWALSSTFIFIGTRFYNFAKEPLNNLQYIHYLLDLRIVFGILMVFLLVVFSTIKVFSLERPKVAMLQEIQILHLSDGLPDIIKAIIRQFLLVLDFILLIMIGFINIVWLIIATLCINLYRVGKEILYILKIVLFRFIKILPEIFMIFLILVATSFSKQLSSTSMEYLRIDIWKQSYPYLMKVASSAFMIIFCIFGITYLSSITIQDKAYRDKVKKESWNLIASGISSSM